MTYTPKVGDCVRFTGDAFASHLHSPEQYAMGDVIDIDEPTGSSKVYFLQPVGEWWLMNSSLELVRTATQDDGDDASVRTFCTAYTGTREGETLDSVKLKHDLRTLWPHGHAGYIPAVVEQIALHSDKNHDYARGGDPLGNFARVAAILAQWWPDVFGGANGPAIVAFIYALKQVDAEAWSMKQGGECKVEGIEARLQDQAIYANIRLCMAKDKK